MERKIAAIISADVAGYSRLVETFEQQTHDRLRSVRDSIIGPGISTHQGTIVKRTGDGFLAMFAEAQQAVRFSIAMQDRMSLHEAGVQPEQALAFRIGISFGEMLVEAEDVFGHDVNVAARLQELAEPGSVLVSEGVHERLAPEPDWHVVDLGAQALRNMSRPVRAFRFGRHQEARRPRSAASTVGRPSIAVLPFRTLQAEPELEHVGEGIVEDIVAALASLRELMVISRNSTLRYRNSSLSAGEVGRELGVRYVLSGSARRSLDRFRIVAELADAADEAVVWAQRYDFTIDDLFEVQDRITGVIANTLAPQIQQAEVQRALQKRPESMTAYDHFSQALSLIYRLREEEFARAGTMLRRAIALDDSYAAAYALAAEWHGLRVGQGWSPDPVVDARESIRLADASIERDPRNALALANLGHHRAYLLHDYEMAQRLFDRALAANPGHARAWALSAPTFTYIGDPEAALIRAQQALTLSPYDPLAFWCKTTICIAHYTRGDFASAIEWGRAALADNPRYTTIWRKLAAALAAEGEIEAAQRAGRQLLELEPGFRSNQYAAAYPFRETRLREQLRQHLVAAGLPP